MLGLKTLQLAFYKNINCHALILIAQCTCINEKKHRFFILGASVERQRGTGAHDTGQVSCIKSDEIVSYKYMARRCFPTKDIVYLKNECV